MTGLVLELQRDALNPEIKVSNLLRKALVISKKLDIIEIEGWLNKELNGYLDGNVPQYRVVHGQVKADDPYNGWMTVIFDNSWTMIEELSTKNVVQTIAEIEILSEGDGDLIQSNFPPEIERFLMGRIKSNYLVQPFLIIPKTEFQRILEAVRNKILDWSLELEQQGILGEGMSFSNEEKTKAHQTTYQVTNNIGSMYNSQFQQDSAHATQSLNVTETNQSDLKAFVEELKSIADSLQLAQEQRQELNEHITILESQSKSAKPNHVIIKESGRTVRNIIEGAIGSTVSTGLVAYFHLFQF